MDRKDGSISKQITEYLSYPLSVSDKKQDNPFL